jgi:hypothetical protein
VADLHVPPNKIHRLSDVMEFNCGMKHRNLAQPMISVQGPDLRLVDAFLVRNYNDRSGSPSRGGPPCPS